MLSTTPVLLYGASLASPADYISLSHVETASIRAVASTFGVISGGILYTFSCSRLCGQFCHFGTLGNFRMRNLAGLPDWVSFTAPTVMAVAHFVVIERREQPIARNGRRQ